jgi:hypothetical protein
MKKLILLILVGISSIMIGASILNKENNNSKNDEVFKMQNAHLLYGKGTVLKCFTDKKELLIQIDDSDDNFLYDEITLIYIGASNDHTINSLKIGEKIEFSYFPDESTNKQILNVYMVEKIENK